MIMRRNHTGEEEKRMNEHKPMREQNWREVPRTEMLERVIIAVDCARGDAEAHGDEGYVDYCEWVLFPFLEAEKERAEARA
jgi:hypothetical protein